MLRTAQVLGSATTLIMLREMAARGFGTSVGSESSAQLKGLRTGRICGAVSVVLVANPVEV